MPVSTILLETCRRSEEAAETQVVDAPSWKEVEAAIRRLDGHKYSDLHIYPDRTDMNTSMVIGGGAGAFVVGATIGGARHFALTRAVKCCAGLAPIVVGGQLSEYPHHLVVDLEAALGAASALVQVGSIQLSDSWEEI